jgi:hypothetical protein
MRLDEWLSLWTGAEREVLAVVARDRVWMWVREHALPILDQARAIGELAEPEPH